MTFKENINRICKEKGTNLTKVFKDCGMSSSRVTAVNSGSIPKEETMLLLADHLGCSVMDFFYDGLEIETRTKPVDEDEEELLEIFRGLNRSDKHRLMAYAYKYVEGQAN